MNNSLSQIQCADSIMMVRPACFGYNLETEDSNSFQSDTKGKKSSISKKAIREFDQMHRKLSEKGINVTVIADSEFPSKPDAVFPNNWVSFHEDGTVVLYPMMAENRRLERRSEIIEELRKTFEIKYLIDLSENEKRGIFLEGTGSVVFDHQNRIAYACLSPRTNKNLFEKLCADLKYQAVHFKAFDKVGKAIYHTNVMLSIGNDFAVICLESIMNDNERVMVAKSLEDTGHQIIKIDFSQMASFSANMLELNHPKRNILALSTAAFSALDSAQKTELEKYCDLFPLDIPTVENIGGGSVRCMIAEVFLPICKA